MSLLNKLLSDYGVDDQKLLKILREADEQSKLKTWKDFANILANQYEENDMSVYKSSTWAVCQEFLGNLHGEDLNYAQSRGGIWSLDRNISVREILEALQKSHL